MVGREPPVERGSHVEAQLPVVVHDPRDEPVASQKPGGRVGGIALCGDPVVPVAPGRSRSFRLDGSQPGIFTVGLVEMGVNRDSPQGDPSLVCGGVPVSSLAVNPCSIIG